MYFEIIRTKSGKFHVFSAFDEEGELNLHYVLDVVSQQVARQEACRGRGDRPPLSRDLPTRHRGGDVIACRGLLFGQLLPGIGLFGRSGLGLPQRRRPGFGAHT